VRISPEKSKGWEAHKPGLLKTAFQRRTRPIIMEERKK